MKEFNEKAFYLLVWRAALAALVGAVLIVTRTAELAAALLVGAHIALLFSVGARRAAGGTGWPPVRTKEPCGNGISVRKGLFGYRGCIDWDSARDFRGPIGIVNRSVTPLAMS